MKPLLITLLLATLCATGYGQTIKSLGYNTTNNTIVGLTNNQRLAFEHISVTTGTAAAPSLVYLLGTNTFGTFASTAFGIGPFLGFSVDGNRRFFISTNTIRAELPISFSAGNDSATRTNLGLGATWLTNDNVTNFRTAIGLGATNEVTFQNVKIEAGALYVGQGTNQYFYAGDDVVESYVPVIILHPNGLSFEGTNAAAARVSTMRALSGSTNTNEPFSGTITVRDDGNDNRDIVISNGIILSVSDSY